MYSQLHIRIVGAGGFKTGNARTFTSDQSDWISVQKAWGTGIILSSLGDDTWGYQESYPKLHPPVGVNFDCSLVSWNLKKPRLIKSESLGEGPILDLNSSTFSTSSDNLNVQPELRTNVPCCSDMELAGFSINGMDGWMNGWMDEWMERCTDLCD